MRQDKEKATELRKLGKSYKQIHAELKIPLSTLSGWFGKIGWSKELASKLAGAANKKHTARIVSLNATRGKHLARAYKTARKEARFELEAMQYSPVFIAGVMLYWGEGDKSQKRSALRLSNTDPELIRLYVFFLKQVCRIPVNKIKAQVLIYPDLSEEACLQYWERSSGLPRANFTRSTKILGRHKTKRLPFGVCLITVSSYYLKEKMLLWIRVLPTELMSRRYYENIRG